MSTLVYVPCDTSDQPTNYLTGGRQINDNALGSSDGDTGGGATTAVSAADAEFSMAARPLGLFRSFAPPAGTGSAAPQSSTSAVILAIDYRAFRPESKREEAPRHPAAKLEIPPHEDFGVLQ